MQFFRTATPFFLKSNEIYEIYNEAILNIYEHYITIDKDVEIFNYNCLPTIIRNNKKKHQQLCINYYSYWQGISQTYLINWLK